MFPEQKQPEAHVTERPDASTLEQLASNLVDYIKDLGPCVVALSGGVDSAVVAKAAVLAVGENAFAVTGTGPAVSQEDVQSAIEVGTAIGIRHVFLDAREIDDQRYVVNDAKRCYYCKSNLYDRLGDWGRELGVNIVLSGTNADDLDDYRPGLMAAQERGVIAPLSSLKISKTTVRLLAKHWDLPVADRPASPCLASRIAYGESVSQSKLERIGAAESWLKAKGFRDVRVRLHPGDLARVEINPDQWTQLFAHTDREQLSIYERMVKEFKSLGFRYVTLDLDGRSSGSLNRLLPILS